MVWCGAVLYRVYVHRIAEIKEGMQAMVSFGLYTRHLNSKLYMARKMGSGIVAESGAMVDWSAAEVSSPSLAAPSEESFLFCPTTISFSLSACLICCCFNRSTVLPFWMNSGDWLVNETIDRNATAIGYWPIPNDYLQ